MDSDDEQMGIVCELGDGIFSLAGTEYRVVGHDSAFPWICRIFFIRIAGDALERVIGIYEFDGSPIDRVRHAG